MKITTIIAMVMLYTTLAGCESKESKLDEKPLPEVNDQNCLPDNIAKLTPDNAREQFASLCLRRSSFNASEKKEW